MSDLAGRASIVTGGSRGIGRATALALAEAGSSVLLVYREHDDEAAEVESMCRALGVDAHTLRRDVGEPGSSEDVVTAALELFGRLDCLVNNAGISHDGSLRRLDRAAYEEVLNVNLLGAAQLATAASRAMGEAGFGRIVNLTSVVADTGAPGAANYAASKGALAAWTRSAALEWARHGITVNVVVPGYVETALLRTIPQEMLDRLLASIPLGRFGRPEEVAEAVLFLLRSDYVTGARVDVNGGFHMP